MVQILEPGRSFGGEFAKALGGGLGKGFSQSLSDIEEEKRLGRLQEKKEQSEFRKLAEQSRLKRETDLAKIEAKQNMINSIFGLEQPKKNISQQLQGIGELPEEIPMQMSQDFDASKITDEQILQFTAAEPALGNALAKAKDVALREQTEEKKFKEKKISDLRKERAPLISKIIEQADLSRESIRNKNHLMNIIDQGNLDDPTYAVFASSLPFNLGKRLLSNDTVEYKGALVDEFSDLKNVFKGATRVKEVEIYEDKLPDIYLTDEQKKTILKSRIKTSKVDLLREEAAQEAEEKFPNLTALQFNKKVDQLLEPKLNALFNQIWNQQKAVIDAAESKKSLPLDINDPEDKRIMQQILKEAGGDKTKAKQLAKKKGYTILGG